MAVLRYPPAWVLLTLVFTVAGSQKTKVFSLPNSRLLFGNYNDLRVVGPDWHQELRPPIGLKYNGGYFVVPSLAARGDVVAWGFATEASVIWPEVRIRFALGLYSVTERKWSTYGNFEDIGDVALSPTGSKVAFIAKRNGTSRLLIFDVTKQTFTDGPHPAGIPERSSLSWSPDETRLAAEIWRAGESLGVGVLDLASGAVRILGEGYGPRWSPSGEWIAFYASGRECALVHSDGTGKKVVAKLGRSRSFSWGSPVWSPDGTQVLANARRGDGPLGDVVLIDVTSGRITTRLSEGLPVFGWASLRP